MKKLNILFYSENEIVPLNGGTERATHVLAEFFKSKGFKIKYLLRNYITIDNNKNDTFYFPNVIDLNSETNVKFLNNIFINNNFNFLIITIPTPQLFFLLKRVEKRPKVITIIHASILEYLPYFSMMYKFRFNTPAEIVASILRVIRLPFLYFLFQNKLKSKFRLINNSSDRIVVLSENYKNDLLRLSINVESEKIVSIENSNPYYFQKFNYKEKTNQIIFVGRLTHIKRVDHILKSWDLIISKNSNWLLKIIGDGEDKNTLKKFVSKNKINNVSFEGNIDPQFDYRISSIICLTSVYEGMPMVLLEALQFGVVPIVYNSFGSASDIIKNGFNGYLVKPFDYRSLSEHISYLINNPKKLENMSKNAFESSKRYDMNIVGEKWIRFLENTYLV